MVHTRNKTMLFNVEQICRCYTTQSHVSGVKSPDGELQRFVQRKWKWHKMVTSLELLSLWKCLVGNIRFYKPKKVFIKKSHILFRKAAKPLDADAVPYYLTTGSNHSSHKKIEQVTNPGAFTPQ